MLQIIHRIASFVFGHQNNNQAKTTPRSNRVVPMLEQLEDRTALTTIGIGGNSEIVNLTAPSDSVTDLYISQPNPNLLLRFTGGPLKLDGEVADFGNVVIVDTQGITLGPNASVNTHGFVASTLDISDSDFKAGIMKFTLGNNTPASVVNQGTFTPPQGGFIDLFGPSVNNQGDLSAPGGNIAIATGDTITMDSLGSNQGLVVSGNSDSTAPDLQNSGLIRTNAIETSSTGHQVDNDSIVPGDISLVSDNGIFVNILSGTSIAGKNVSLSTNAGDISVTSSYYDFGYDTPTIESIGGTLTIESAGNNSFLNAYLVDRALSGNASYPAQNYLISAQQDLSLTQSVIVGGGSLGTTNSFQAGGNLVFDATELQGSNANLNLSAGNDLTLNDGSQFNLSNGNLSAIPGTTTPVSVVSVSAGHNVTIEDNSFITAVGYTANVDAGNNLVIDEKMGGTWIGGPTLYEAGLSMQGVTTGASLLAGNDLIIRSERYPDYPGSNAEVSVNTGDLKLQADRDLIIQPCATVGFDNINALPGTLYLTYGRNLNAPGRENAVIQQLPNNPTSGNPTQNNSLANNSSAAQPSNIFTSYVELVSDVILAEENLLNGILNWENNIRATIDTIVADIFNTHKAL